MNTLRDGIPLATNQFAEYRQQMPAVRNTNADNRETHAAAKSVLHRATMPREPNKGVHNLVGSNNLGKYYTNYI